MWRTMRPMKLLGSPRTLSTFTLPLVFALSACGGRATGMSQEGDGSGSATEGEGGGDPASESMTSSGSEGTRTAGASSGSASSAGSTSPPGDTVGQTTLMNDDGSTTTITTQADGTTITTTIGADGSETTTVMSTDGTVVATAGGGVAIVEPIVGRPVMGGIAIGPRGAPGAPSTPGEPLDNCKPDYQGSGPESCEIGLACDNGYAWSACYDNGNDGWYCDCQSNNGWTQIQIPNGSELDSPCASVVDLCANGLNAETAEPQCTPTYQQEDSSYCSLDYECRTTVETEGVSLDVLQFENVWCENTGTEWHCGCYQNNASYDLTLAHDEANVCQDVRDLCLAGIDSDGDYECERDYQSASTQSCDASLRCGQSTVIDETEVQVNGYMSVSCQPAQEEEGGAWQCYCSGLGVSDEFQISEASDAWETCSGAILQCGELVSGG